jgi:hypothetical protein
MKKVLNNTGNLNEGRHMTLMKKFLAASGILAAALVLSLGCTSSTGSSTSGSSISVPRIQITIPASSLQASQRTTDTSGAIIQVTWSSTFVTVIVRDNSGNLVPAGTSVNIACGAGFLGNNPDANNPVSSLTVTTNANGQAQVQYTAGFTTGTATISATSSGNSGSVSITIV